MGQQFALEAERPTQDKFLENNQAVEEENDLQPNWRKYKLTLKMTQNKDKWRVKLQELFHRDLES